MRFFCVLFFLYWCLSANSYADEDCPTWHFDDHNTGQLAALNIVQQRTPQHAELFVIHSQTQASTKLSLHGNAQHGCQFSTVTAIAGGDWGWHIAWIHQHIPGVFYARLDAQAWVTSPPKRLSPLRASTIELQQTATHLQLNIVTMDGLTDAPLQLHSEDEGKHWQ